MKYKVGDKVIIKEKYRANMFGSSNNNSGVIEITGFREVWKTMWYYSDSEKIDWFFSDEQIECLPFIHILTPNRFDILDIRD